MASIHKRTGSRYWACCFRLPDGKRVYRSTGTANRAEAMRRACEMESEEVEKAKAPLQKQFRMLAKLQEAKELAQRGDLSIERARDIMALMVAESTGKRMRFYSVREWAAEWLAGKQGTAAESSLSSYRRFVNGFVEFIGPAADKPLEALDQGMVRGFRDSLREGGRLARTCNQAVKILRIWLRAAVTQGHLSRSPAAGVPLLLETDSIDRVPFEEAELLTLLKVAEGAWKAVIMLGVYGGLRLRDAANLRWSAIDFEAGTLRFRPFKTARSKTDIVLPLHSSLVAVLKELPLSIDPTGFVFPELAGRPTGGKPGLSSEFIAIMDRAGVERDRTQLEADGSRVVCGRRSFHSLRHTFATLLAKGGVAEGLRMELAGHKTADMARHYTHNEIETLRAAVGTLPRFI